MSAVALLGRLGDFGLFAPLAAVGLGWLLPPLGSVGHALLVPSVILMFTMSVALVQPGRLHWWEAFPVFGLALCNLVLSPVLTHSLARAVGLDEVGGWLVLVAACPAAGAASLMAGLLGLPMRPMLLAQLLSFFALPVTAPLVASLVLDAAVVEPGILLWRVAVMVALPTLLGLGLRLVLGHVRRTRAFGLMRGMGLLGLCGVGLAISHGLAAKLPAAIPWASAGLGLAIVVLIGAALGGLTGLLSGRLGGESLGRAFGLGGAVRNVSLLWSATIGIAPPEGEVVMMLGTVWTFVLPALLGLRGWRPYQAVRTLVLADVAGAASPPDPSLRRTLTGSSALFTTTRSSERSATSTIVIVTGAESVSPAASRTDWVNRSWLARLKVSGSSTGRTVKVATAAPMSPSASRTL